MKFTLCSLILRLSSSSLIAYWLRMLSVNLDCLSFAAASLAGLGRITVLYDSDSCLVIIFKLSI